MSPENNTNPCYESIFVSRQPIFTSEMNIWGYELLFQNFQDLNAFSKQEAGKTSSKAIIDGFSAAGKGITPETKILINFPRNAILEGIPYALPWEQVIIGLTEKMLPEREVFKKCVEYKKNGFEVTLDDFQGHLEYKTLLNIMDILKVDVSRPSKLQTTKIINKLKNFSLTILAERVETREMFEFTKKLGCELFQGFFFTKPEIIPGRTIQGNQAVKLRLLNLLNHQQEYNPHQLSEVVQTDISLSYRLLKFINSPGIGLSQKISSIRHAINLLGYQRIFHWIRVLILSDMNNSPKGMELTLRSAQRGHFLQLLTEGMDAVFDSDGMFLLGLFSLLDSILNQSMDEIMQYLPLEETLANTLLGYQTPARIWLKLVEAQERANWKEVQGLILNLNLIPEYTAACYVQAINWAHELMNPSGDQEDT